MDKNTLSSFAWIIVTLMVMAVLIMAATPFGEMIQNGLMSFTEQYVDAATEKPEDVDLPSFSLRINYVVADGETPNPASYLSSMKKYSQYNINPPEVHGYEPHIEVVQGILTEDTTLTVNYTKATYDIIYNLNAGSWVSGSASVKEYTYGDTITLPTASELTKEYSTFDGWYTRSDFKGEKVLQITPSNVGDIKYYSTLSEVIVISYNDPNFVAE